jgi:hypothetical protein
MLKNESSRNPTKPTPLRPARLPDFGGIFTLSNRLRMRKLSRSDRKPKQVKSEISLIRLIKIFATILLLLRADLIHWGFLDAF